MTVRRFAGYTSKTSHDLVITGFFNVFREAEPSPLNAAVDVSAEAPPAPKRRPRAYARVTAPSEALPTSRAYFASTPSR